jgi:hypothetical protein
MGTPTNYIENSGRYLYPFVICVNIDNDKHPKADNENIEIVLVIQ